ncbi:MAG: hypothetical protein M8860_01740 [marine benthic group bacterium]|nr:hypothetical protein [Gemmatimonadota bacterium]MCL7961556.1 hypothetical protein [Candidatus Carthagonibacter metallireducens]MCL7969735.1 hypothetical protein [Gemmatimonadota bacterium]MCL7975152.1 hypothetical protein [Gemmatimonadota bacterium]MCL7979316.1 hypothetical protein [Gemmatimonadota bacterium]
MRWRIPLIATLVLFTAISCDQSTTAPEPTAVAESPSFNFMNGPANPGEAWIERWNGQWFFWNAHPEQNLEVEYVYAEDLGQYVAGYHCGGSQDIPRWDKQMVGNPDIAHVKMLFQDKSRPVYVYDLDAIFEAFHSGDPEVFCPFMANEWLYRGEINMVYTDNNWWWNPDYANPFGYHGNGIVWDHDGNRYTYHESIRGKCENSVCEYSKYDLVIRRVGNGPA